MILQPAPDAKKREVMSLLQSQTQVAKEPQSGFRRSALTQFPAEIQQQIRLLTRNGSGSAEEFIDYIQRATQMTRILPAFSR